MKNEESEIIYSEKKKINFVKVPSENNSNTSNDERKNSKMRWLIVVLSGFSIVINFFN